MGKSYYFEIYCTSLAIIDVLLVLRMAADHPFHRTQLRIMLDQTGPMLDDFADSLVGGAYDPEDAE